MGECLYIFNNPPTVYSDVIQFTEESVGRMNKEAQHSPAAPQEQGLVSLAQAGIGKEMPGEVAAMMLGAASKQVKEEA